jgi:hypothetical protein
MTRWLAMSTLLGLVLLTRLAGGVEVSLVNESMEMVFDLEAQGGLCGLRNIPCDTVFLPPLGESAPNRSPWLLVLRAADGGFRELTARDATRLTHRLSGRTLELAWTGVRAPGLDGELSVTVQVLLVPSEGKSRWEIAVEGSLEGALWDVQFPRLLGLKGPSDDELALPLYLGRLVRDPIGAKTQVLLDYPQPASMQWLAYWGTPTPRLPALSAPVAGTVTESGWRPDLSAAAGLYLAAEDGDGWHKRFAVDTRTVPGRLSWWVHHLPPLDQWPITPGQHPVSYVLPYPVVLTAFRGDYHEAAAIYRDWARRKAWCRRGTAESWPQQAPAPGTADEALWVPLWFRQIGFWAKFYHEPAKVVPEWAAYKKWLRVPLASHYYRYTIARFDDDYPEPLPADPYLLQGMVAAREMGVMPLPYINGVIWDTDTQSWRRENGQAAAVKDDTGRLVPWTIASEVFAHMCPVEPWRAKLRETTGKLVGEQGMAGVYLDCLAAVRTLPCYDPQHQHSLHGGDHRSQNNRRLMEELRLSTRRKVPDACFFTEEIGEQFLDLMDGFLTLDLTRSSLGAGEQVFPLFSAVYHPYTINFGSDAQLDLDADAFALQMGTLFTWGFVPLLSTSVAVPPREGDRNSELLRELVQAYYRVGKPFLQDGQWERLALVPTGSSRPTGRLALAAAPHTVAYGVLGGKRRQWQGPAVLGSAWRQGNAVGVALVNLTAVAQNAELWLDLAGLGLAADSRLTVLWPDAAAAELDDAGACRISLGPNQAMILAVGASSRPVRRQPLEECPWELLTATAGAMPPQVEKEGRLWACSDGLVAQGFGANESTVEALSVDGQGALVPRLGRQAERRGPAAEGWGLPRRQLEQPFALLRRLPHRVSAGEPRVTVWGGEADWLLCRVSGAGELNFAKPGLVAGFLAGGGTGPIALPPLQSALAVSAGAGERLVGYWAPDKAAGKTILERAKACGVAVTEAEVVRRALEGLCEAPSVETLGVLSQSLAALFEACRRTPSMASPGSPLLALAQRVNALVSGVSGIDATLVSEDDWLTPGLPKAVTLITHGSSVAPTVRLTALADVPAEALEISLVPAAAGSNLVTAQVLLRQEDYVERLVPVVAFVGCPVGAADLRLTAVLWLESNRPLALNVPLQAAVAVAGRSVVTELTVRNLSPQNLTVAAAATGPEGWVVSTVPAEIHLPALLERPIRLTLTPPLGAKTQTANLLLTVKYAPGQVDGMTADIPCEVRERLGVLRQPNSAVPVVATKARLRRSNQVALWRQAGEEVQVTVRNLRVTKYVDTLKARLLDVAFATVASGTAPVDEGVVLTAKAAEAGVLHVLVDAGSGSAEVEAGGLALAEVATADVPLSLFCSPIKRWFYVPKGARTFHLAARDGGETETARIRISAPDGRVALDRDGRWVGTPQPIEVGPEAAGRVWTLECWPLQDISLWLGGEVCPYLSSDPAEVPAPLADLALP